jgi:hypothetical protein
MALDFPSSPTTGQSFTAANVIWTWDGAKWTASGVSQAYLPLTGGTLTGTLNGTSAVLSATLDAATANFTGAVTIATAPGTAKQLVGESSNSASRWAIFLGDTTAETGNNAGSNFDILAYTDIGNPMPAPDLTINRATGIVSIPNLSAPQAIGDNRIINGDMRIDQRNNGASGTAVGYTVDRWQFLAASAAVGSWGRNFGGSIVGPPGFPYCLGFQCVAYTLAATDYFVFQQVIEADAVSDFQWGTAGAQPVTLSFWAYSNVTGTFGGSIANAANTRAYPFTYSIPTASTWTKIVLTIPGDIAGIWVMSGNAASIRIDFSFGVGATYSAPAGAWIAGNYASANGAVSIFSASNNYFFVSGVKLEIGSVSTPFNQQSLAKSMADCQRYYQWGNWALAGNALVGINEIVDIPLPVMMRSAPTLNYSIGGSANIASGAPTPLTNVGLQVNVVSAASGGYLISGVYTVSAEL